jgi:hypothetical protein
MAPLLPSESAVYAVELPEELVDARLNLSVRTGSALTYTRSAVVVHGGLTVGLGLSTVTIPEIEGALRAEGLSGWPRLVSNEIFYLNIVNRKWNRAVTDDESPRPKPRIFHALAFSGRSIFLFGGLIVDENADRLIPTNELWVFDIDACTWSCLDDGLHSGTVSRYDHTILKVNYVSPADHKKHSCIAIAGGRGELNQELMHISIFDLESREYINNTEMQLTLNELKQRNDSVSSGIDPRRSSNGARVKLKATKEKSFIISGTSQSGVQGDNDTLYIYSQDPSELEPVKNPIVSLPMSPNSSGSRLPIASTSNKSVVPRSLRRPTGGMFGPNIFVSGINLRAQEYQVYLFNRPSEKWCRLNIDNKKKASDLYLWKSFSWNSHHRVLILGSSTFPKGAKHGTTQKFDTIVLAGLPITNIFHAYSAEREDTHHLTFTNIKKSTTFEAYSKYIAPTSKISSIRSVFPSYAVTLGRNAFERFGSSLADFEFISSDGDKVNVPLMLLRKRWGRCFDMLLAKAYAAAVHKLESGREETAEEDDTTSVMSGPSKKSVLMLNRASNQQERAESPQFRLPFQDKTPAPTAPSSIMTPDPQSRKPSVVSTGNDSILTTSTSDLPEGPDFTNIPPIQPAPTEPLPPIDMKAPLKSISSKDYLRDSPRGSLSGVSLTPTSTNVHQPSISSVKLMKTPVSALKMGGTSRSSSVNNPDEDAESTNDSQVESHLEDHDESKELLEPLLIPRSLYLPFSTSTVQAFTEFLSTGQLGDKWLLSPTTTDTFLLAKFYELPLLYDLISEVLYAMIGKKENTLMSEFNKFRAEYKAKLYEIFNHDDKKVSEYSDAHPSVQDTFREIESYLNTVDDGYLNVPLLRKASKASSFEMASTASRRGSFDFSPRRSSARAVKLGKSSLSKEMKDDDGDDIDNEAENDMDDNEDKRVTDEHLRFSTRSHIESPIKFRTDSMSRVSLKRSDTDDGIDPLSKTVSNVIDDDSESPSPRKSNTDIQSEESTDHQPSMQVAEGSFKLPKDQWKSINVHESNSSANDDDDEGKKKSSTSDSDEMAVGLGLVTNLKLKKKKKNSDEVQEDDLNDDLPTLENLASPGSPAPDDHLIQVIYEAAALACDMKLLLRSLNILTMTKALRQRKATLLEELELIVVTSKEDEQKRASALREEAKILTEQERKEHDGVEISSSPQHQETTESARGNDASPKQIETSATMRREDSPAFSATSTLDNESINSKSSHRYKLPPIRSFSSLSISNRKPSSIGHKEDTGAGEPRTTFMSKQPEKKKILGFIPRRHTGK